MKKFIQALVLSVLLCGSVMAEPTIREIYQTAQTDNKQALVMIEEVIKNHPNSARAYYIQSELLLQARKKSQARDSFFKSQALDPQLGFAKPESVARLRNELGIKPGSTSSFDVNKLILYGCGMLLVIILAVLIFRRRNPPESPMANYSPVNRPLTPFSPQSPSPQPVGGGGASATAPTGGSGIMGSLAQGAAMGVGVAAGATLANHLLNGNKATAAPQESAPVYEPRYQPDQNFGITDTGSDWGSDSSSDSGGSSDSW